MDYQKELDKVKFDVVVNEIVDTWVKWQLENPDTCAVCGLPGIAHDLCHEPCNYCPRCGRKIARTRLEALIDWKKTLTNKGGC